jgi:predicted SprT family Zn-dependent metalloprotease
MNLLLAEKLCKHLMKEWDIDPKWEFCWSNGKRQLGCVKQTKPEFVEIQRAAGKKVISKLCLSRHLVRNNPEDEVRDTILHEIAHIKAGHEAGHGPLWKQWARKVGARPVRCATQVLMVQAKYIVVCTVCDSVTRKAHKRVKLARRYCRKCGVSSSGKLELRHNPEAGQVK